MQPQPIRPRFEIEIAAPPAEAMARLRQRLPGCRTCAGVSVGSHAELLVPVAERRIWSPWLSVTADDAPSGGAVIRGRFGPHPSLWTLYLFLALGLGFAALVALTWGYAQWAMAERPWVLAGVPAAALAGALLYACSLAGQHLGRAQMVTLRGALEELLAEPD